MREIKFKAWDKKKKDFVFYPKGIQTTVMLDGSKAITIDDEDVEFLLFTGLKDKNDKEIYEGDIVKFGKSIFVVKYCKEFASFKKFFPDPDGHVTDLINSPDLYEVIGNVFENPELLEQAE